MNNLKFNCPHCNQSIEVPEKIPGQTLKCPSCQRSIKFSKSHPEVTAPPIRNPVPPPIPDSQEPKTKDCQYCGETILAKAKKCKHCGEILDAKLKRQRQTESAEQPPQEKVIVEPREEGCFLQTLNFGCGIIFIFIIFIMLILIFGGLYT